ncbi:5'-nucleotidase C-terminal domain-containing protein [Nonomuraea sp. NN258]|uniref:5'-nucleotidase n=1 Tax=Nonomuraea antri TaxID=2730852 RepID=UPI001C2C3B0E|nr:5'-nucleotidase [Nonomuraea antri]NRQ30253.1 5'-nucleotidase C-terminal domain-containing protein [Nonomuraea antri]
MTVTLSTTVKVKAPVALKYQWTFSDGDKSKIKTYRIGGKGVKTVRLSTTLKVGGDATGWGAVRVVSPAKKTSKKASFAVTCSGGDENAGDVWDSVNTSVEYDGATTTPSPSPTASPSPTPTPTPTPTGTEAPLPNLVRKARIAFERTTASKCPLTFKLHGRLEGIPAGAQSIQYRLVGAKDWKTLSVPAGHGPVHNAVLETLSWDQESTTYSVQIEFNQADRLRTNLIYYFECAGPGENTRIGMAADDIKRDSWGSGPIAELVADAMLESVQPVSGAQIALVSKYAFRSPSSEIKKGPVTYGQLYATQPSGLHVDTWSMNGSQLKWVLGHASKARGVLTPSAGLRYTLTDGVVTEITLNGAPVTDTQVIKVAANYILAGGFEGFPQWKWPDNSVAHSGPDDRGALGSYFADHSPVSAPKGDRVKVLGTIP